eukprot:gb/GECG01004536.1/.p1 GENE.gb/GECG01004536.1/~~gb/GECG01004536.1/.p1  ORF type:complete len:117 (+),score=4.86 gb/GECG01004536.1/:1-351(+)
MAGFDSGLITSLHGGAASYVLLLRVWYRFSGCHTADRFVGDVYAEMISIESRKPSALDWMSTRHEMELHPSQRLRAEAMLPQYSTWFPKEQPSTQEATRLHCMLPQKMGTQMRWKL